MAVTPDTILRRQINYLIVKETWCIFQGTKSQLALYNKLKMSRQLYSRIMTGQCDTQLDLQAKRGNENTGIDTDIFKGKKAIKIDGFNEEDWENFFGYIYSNKKSKDYRDYIKKLRNHIILANEKIQKQGNNILSLDENLRLLIFFAKYGSKEEMLNNYTVLNNIIQAIERVDIRFLESVIELEQDEDRYSTLKKYMDALRKQYELTNSVYIYKINNK